MRAVLDGVRPKEAAVANDDALVGAHREARSEEQAGGEREAERPLPADRDQPGRQHRGDGAGAG